MIDAIKRGDENTVKLLVTIGVNIHIPGLQGSYPLHYGISEGLCQSVELFLEQGADPNVPNLCGNTPLVIALGSGKRGHPKKKVQELVGILLEKGADPNLLSPNGNRPLHWAALRGFNTVVTMLLEYGARIDDHDLHGTALYAAANAGEKETAQLLLAYGAAPDGLLNLLV